MKKMASLFTLIVFLWTSFLTPVSYAQTSETWNILSSETATVSEQVLWGTEIWETETWESEVQPEIMHEEQPAQNIDDWKDEKSDLDEDSADEISEIDPTNNQVDAHDVADENFVDEGVKTTQLDLSKSEILWILQTDGESEWSGTMFIPWREFNLRLKSLANDTEYYDTWDYDENIIKFEKSKTPVPVWVTTTWLATDDSEYNIIAWYNNWTIYYYTEADVIYLNPDSSHMFSNMVNITTVDTSKWDTSKVRDMSQMFLDCSSLTEIDVSSWDTSYVEVMERMFDRCLNLEKLDVSHWDTSKVKDMSQIFYRCDSLKELDVSNRDTSIVTDMEGMFHGCMSLKELDVSNRDTSRAENMGNMFGLCYNIKELDVSNRDTSRVENMEDMFNQCFALKELDVSRWNTNNVKSMNGTFAHCINITELNLSNWDTRNVEYMSRMFYQCDSLETIYVSDKFKTNNVSQWYDMFWNNYSLIWWNWTKFDSNYVDYDYATIDAADNPWYFTDINSNKVVVRFFTNGWSDVDIQVIEKWNTIESVQPSKDNAEFKWWYSDEWLTRNFNPFSVLNSNLKLYAKWECKPWYYDNRWICTDENKKIEHKWWVIKITDWENTVYIKDRNQWATESRWSTLIHKLLNPVLQNFNHNWNITLWWLYRYVAKELSEIAWEDMFTLWELKNHYDGDWINIIKDIKLKNEERNYNNSYWDYYYRWNNTWLAYKDIWFKDIEWYAEIWYFFNEIRDWLSQWLGEYLNTLFVDIPESKIEWWFNGWKIWQEWEWWIQWNSNPCDASKWEYLPTLQDWVKLMQVWWNINWKEVVKTEQELWENTYGEVYVFGSWLDNLVNWISNSPMELLELLNLDITEDLMIPWAWWIVKYDSDLVREIMRMQGAPEEEIDDMIENTINRFGSEYIRIPLLSPLWVASESWDTVWIYIWEAGIISVTNDIWAIANSIAAPVRCFVDESAWPKDEEKKENNYSGWGWRWSSSKSEADTHWSADEQKDVNNDKKTDEKQEEVQKENKSDTPISQDNQWNKWSNSASDEFQQAYDFARENWITTKSTIQEAQMNWNLTRIQMAKMLSQYAINVLWQTPDTSKTIKFKDVTDKKNADYDNGVTLAYQLWIMWQNMKDNKFRPNDEVSRAEFVTALSRLLYSTSDWEYKSTSKYYTHHMEKLVSEWIITNDNPTMKEKRWYVMIMLMRAMK